MRVLLLGNVQVLQDVEAALHGFDLRIAETYDGALAALEADAPDAIVLAYHFDQLRPFRLIQHVRGHAELGEVPIIMVRIMSIALGATKDSELEQSYRELGVDDFVNLRREIDEQGREAALRRLRDGIVKRLR